MRTDRGTGHFDADALVIGAGPAGAASAILLAQSGWTVVLAEQHAYPRQKVCGECISAGSVALLDQLGIGAAFTDLAGPELRQVGWMSASPTIVAAFPACADAAHRFGRALGRDHLDGLLLERARALGVRIEQPARVRAIRGTPGNLACDIAVPAAREPHTLRVRVVVDAHGSWESGPQGAEGLTHRGRPRSAADLFAFKASFRNTRLPAGLLPVLSFAGGYGGMVVAEAGRTTVACCIRRDTLHEWRARRPGVPAGAAVAEMLLASCRGLRLALSPAHCDSAWLSVGPLRPGIRVDQGRRTFLVGNAAGESHPLIGEGIAMALQSAGLLARRLLQQAPGAIDARCAADLNRRYAADWRSAFAVRLRLAAAYAQLAMRPALAAPTAALLLRWPALMTRAAYFAGKARRAAILFPAGAIP